MNRNKALRRAIGISLMLGLFAAPYAAPQVELPAFSAPVAQAAAAVSTGSTWMRVLTLLLRVYFSNFTTPSMSANSV